MNKIRFSILLCFSVLSLVLSGCYSIARENISIKATLAAMQDQIANQGGMNMTTPQANVPTGPADVSFTLSTTTDGHNLAFIGVGGEIDGMMNPILKVQPGDIVEITLVNGQATAHNFVIDEFGATTGSVTTQGEQKTTKFLADKEGNFYYYCNIPGHRAAGMEGILQVGEGVAGVQAASIIRNPSDLPGPIEARGPQLVKVELVAQEVEGQLAEGTSFTYFTFNGKVPGPFIRARVGDTVEVTLRNETTSAFVHSVDLHAVNGPGGGAVYTQVQPGETKVFTFKALSPGIFVYHCATPSVPHHISMGMYGLILIEPEGGLPPVDKEFYVMQGEIYTAEPFGTLGHLTFSEDKLLAQTPEYFVFNGASRGLAGEENMLKANVGDTVRIYIGVGGPNFTSSFHVIGEIFDRVYPFGSLTSGVLTNVQTITVAPGGAWVVEFKVDEPGDYVLVDHALSRLERGLVGILHVEGDADPTIFHEGPADQ